MVSFQQCGKCMCLSLFDDNNSQGKSVFYLLNLSKFHENPPYARVIHSIVLSRFLIINFCRQMPARCFIHKISTSNFKRPGERKWTLLHTSQGKWHNPNSTVHLQQLKKVYSQHASIRISHTSLAFHADHHH